MYLCYPVLRLGGFLFLALPKAFYVFSRVLKQILVYISQSAKSQTQRQVAILSGLVAQAVLVERLGLVDLALEDCWMSGFLVILPSSCFLLNNIEQNYRNSNM